MGVVQWAFRRAGVSLHGAVPTVIPAGFLLPEVPYIAIY